MSLTVCLCACVCLSNGQCKREREVDWLLELANNNLQGNAKYKSSSSSAAFADEHLSPRIESSVCSHAFISLHYITFLSLSPVVIAPSPSHIVLGLHDCSSSSSSRHRHQQHLLRPFRSQESKMRQSTAT